MKAQSAIGQSGSLIIVALTVIAMTIYLCIMSGCTGSQVNVKPVTDPAVIAQVLQEAGASFGYYGLRKKSDALIDKISEALRIAKGQLEVKNAKVDLAAVARDLTAEIQDVAGFQDDAAFLISRAVNVLNALIQVDLAIPEKYQGAMDGVRAFIFGAEQGINSLLAQRRRDAGV